MDDALYPSADEALARGTPPSDWPPQLQRAFADALAGRHYDLGRFLLWTGMFVALASSAVDFAVMPDRAPLMIALRLALVVSVQVVALTLPPSRLALQKLLTGISLTAFAGVLLIGVQWAPPLTGAYMAIGPVLMLGVAAHVLPYTTREVALLLLAFTLMTLAVALFVDAPAIHDPAFLGILLLTVVVSAVLPRRLFAIEARTFLLALQSEARLRELEHANSVLDDLSRRDPLTGLANRRHATEVFAGHYTVAPASNEARVVVAMVDLDHFKAFNDRWGHQLGDACLNAVAEELRHCAARNGGLAARFGGEEFVLILRSTSASEIMRVAEALREAIERIEIPHEETGGSATITASVGIAMHPGDGAPDLAHLLGRADAALYCAKTGGRNRCELAA